MQKIKVFCRHRLEQLDRLLLQKIKLFWLYNHQRIKKESPLQQKTRKILRLLSQTLKLIALCRIIINMIKKIH